MSIRTFIVLIVSALFLSGCGGSKAVSGVSLTAEATSQIIDDEPDWWSNPEGTCRWPV